MEQGEVEGMQTFDGVIEKMIRTGVVNKEEALAYSSNPGNLLLRLGAFGVDKPEPKQPPKPKSDSMLDMIER
jgi:twitching motility protein PilT